jgi:outer membrane protein TolC
MRISILLLGSLVLATAQGQTALTLQEALARGLAARADVQVERLSERVLEERTSQARSAYRPRIEATFDGRYNIEQQTNVLPGEFFGQPGTLLPVVFGTEWNATAGLGLTQRLFDPAASGRIRLARLDAAVQRSATAVAEDEARIAIAEAWYQVVLAQAGADLARSTLQRAGQAYAEDSARAVQGALLPVELERSALELGQARRGLERAERELELARAELAQAIGWTDTEPPTVAADALDQLAAGTDEAPTMPLTVRRPELEEARTALERDSAALRNERRSWLPSLDLYANVYRQFYNDVFDPLNDKAWYPWTYVGVRLNLPIWDGGERTHRVREQRLLAEQQALRMADLQRSLTLEARTQVTELALRRAELLDARADVALGERLLELDRVRMAQGTITQAELARTRADLQARTEQLYRATYDFLRAGLLVKRSTGSW